MPPTTQEAVKNWIGQGLLMLIASGLGGYIGVQTTLSEMSAVIDGLSLRVLRVEHFADDHSTTSNEFRERIARLEARQEQVMLNMRMMNLPQRN